MTAEQFGPVLGVTPGVVVASSGTFTTLSATTLTANTAVFPSSSPQTLAAATQVNPNATVVQVIQTSGANITLTHAPTIAAGTDGQLLIIINVGTVSGSGFIFQSADTLASSGLSLNGTTSTVGIKGAIVLVYNSTISRWVQTGSNAGTHGA